MADTKNLTNNPEEKTSLLVTKKKKIEKRKLEVVAIQEKMENAEKLTKQEMQEISQNLDNISNEIAYLKTNIESYGDEELTTQFSELEETYDLVKNKYDELKSLETEVSFGGKIIESGKKIFQKEEWKENTRKNVTRTLLWIGGFLGIRLAYKKVKGWFSKKKGKKKFWDRWYGKTLKWGLIGTGIYTAFDRLTTGKWRFSDWFNKEDKENKGGGAETRKTLFNQGKAVKSFEKIDSQDTKNNLNNYGMGVNAFFDQIYKFNDGSIPSNVDNYKLGVDKEDQYPGVIPHILDNTYKDIDILLSQKALYGLWFQGTAIDVVKTLGSLAAEGADKLVNNILGIVGFQGLWSDKNKDKIEEFLSGKNKADQVGAIFRKIFKAISYTNYLENTYIGKELQLALQNGENIYKKDGNGWEKISCDVEDYSKIQKMSQNYDDYRIGENTLLSDYRNEFRNNKLRDIASYSITAEEVLKFNSNINKNIKQINKKRDKSLETLEKEKDKNEAIKKLQSNIEYDLEDGRWEALRQSFPYFYLYEIFGAGDETTIKKKIRKMVGFEDLLNSLNTDLEGLKEENDIDKVKGVIDNYYASLKELNTLNFAMQEVVDENGNVGWALVGAFTGYFGGIAKQVGLCITSTNEGDWIGTIGHGTAALGSLALVFTPYGHRLHIRVARAGIKAGGGTIKYGLKFMDKQTPFLNIMPTYMVRKYYAKNPQDLVKDFMRGDISVNKASNIVKQRNSILRNKNFNKSGRKYTDILEYLYRESYMFENHAAFFRTNPMYLENARLRFLLFNNGRTSRRINFWDPRWDFKLTNNKFIALKKLDDKIKILDTKNQIFFESVLKKGRFQTMEDLKYFTKYATNNADISKLSNKEIKDLAKKVARQMKSGKFNFVLDNLNQFDEIKHLGQLKVIKSANTITDVTKLKNLKLADNAPNFRVFYQKGDNIDEVTRKILDQWNQFDGKNYFTNDVKISEAKTYAKHIMERYQPIQKLSGDQKTIFKLINQEVVYIKNLENINSLGRIQKAEQIKQLRNFQAIDLTTMKSMPLNSFKKLISGNPGIISDWISLSNKLKKGDFAKFVGEMSRANDMNTLRLKYGVTKDNAPKLFAKLTKDADMFKGIGKTDEFVQIIMKIAKIL